MEIDSLEHLEQAFSSFTKQMIAVAPRRECLTERIARLESLCQELETTGVHDHLRSHGSILATVARMEIRAFEEQVARLTEQAECSEERELLDRLTAVANQGWTAVELLQRAYA